MKKIVLLGCNDKTRAIVPILCKDASVTSEICIASRDKAKCDEIRLQYQGSPVRISTARVDLSNESGTRMMLKISQPDMLVNLTDAAFSPIIMKLCLEIGVPYVDATLFDIGSSDFLSRQFEFFGDFRQKNLTAVVGCEFNPAGITSLVRYSLQEDFDSIDSVDIIEPKAKTSVAKMSIKELNSYASTKAQGERAIYIDGGVKKEAEALSISKEIALPDVPSQEYFVVNNCIVEDFSKELPEVSNVRYFSTVSKPDTSILDELSKFGLLSSEPIEVDGVKIAPIDFISKLLENYEPSNGSVNSDEPSVSNIMAIVLKGKKKDNDKESTIYIKDVLKASANSIAAAIKLVATGKWNRAGVFTPCAFDPSIMVDQMKKDGFKIERLSE